MRTRGVVREEAMILSKASISTSNFTEKEKDSLIQDEMDRLRRICETMDKNRLEVVSGLIQEAAFMAATLCDLRVTISREGVVSIYQNGENQWGHKKSPEIEVYNNLIKNYMQIMKQLVDALPDSVPEDVAKEIAEFIG